MEPQRKRRKDAGVRRSNKPADDSFSFKLNKSDEDEKAAMEVIEEYQSMGLRKLITLALLNFDGRKSSVGHEVNAVDLEELTERFHQELEYLGSIINQLSASGVNPTLATPAKSKKQSNISLGYLNNLKQAMRGSNEDE